MVFLLVPLTDILKGQGVNDGLQSPVASALKERKMSTTERDIWILSGLCWIISAHIIYKELKKP